MRCLTQDNKVKTDHHVVNSIDEQFAQQTQGKEGDLKDFVSLFFDEETYMANVDVIVIQLSNRAPVKYNGTTAEIASLVSYLASKESHFITGKKIAAEGLICSI